MTYILYLDVGITHWRKYCTAVHIYTPKTLVTKHVLQVCMINVMCITIHSSGLPNFLAFFWTPASMLAPDKVKGMYVTVKSRRYKDEDSVHRLLKEKQGSERKKTCKIEAREKPEFRAYSTEKRTMSKLIFVLYTNKTRN